MSTDVTMSTEVQQLWEERRADLNLRNPPEEIERVSLIYFMGCIDLMHLIIARLHTFPTEAERIAWLDGICNECDNKLGAAFPAG